MYDIKTWYNSIKKKSDTVINYANQLVHIITINFLKFFYTVVYFYFMPFLLIFFVSNYGRRRLSIDIDEIGVKGINFISPMHFVNNKHFANYYNEVNVIEN